MKLEITKQKKKKNQKNRFGVCKIDTKIQKSKTIEITKNKKKL